MIELNLRQEDAKLIYLAIAYHLGRPGSELDPITKQPVEHGLAEVARDLQPQLRLAVAQVTLNDNQMKRLTSGMLGSITELKAYPMLQPLSEEDGGGRRSSVRGFDRSLRHLFPEVDEDSEAAYEVAERMLMLKRQIDQKVAALPQPEPPPAQEKKRGWWPFKR
jgi:hypothetical protein